MEINTNGLYILQNNSYIPYTLPNKNMLICGVPGAFTPTCTESHLKGFVDNLDKINFKVAFVSVNDPSVIDAWINIYGDPRIDAVSDPFASFAKSLNMDVCMGDILGTRCKRFTALIENNKLIKFYANPYIQGVLDDT